MEEVCALQDLTGPRRTLVIFESEGMEQIEIDQFVALFKLSRKIGRQLLFRAVAEGWDLQRIVREVY